MSNDVTIVGSYTSPFVRAVRLVAEELGATYVIEPTAFFAKNTEEQEQLIENHNPLMKVPVLKHDGHTIFETRIIINYLLQHFKTEGDFRTNFPTDVSEDNIVSTLLGIMDAGVLRFILKNTHPEIDFNGGYYARSLERMKNGLEWLNQQETLGKSFGVPEALLVCALDWFKKRNVVDCDAYDHLNKVHARFQDREPVINTRVPEDA